MNDIAEKKSDIPEAPPNPPAITLDQIADYYHKKLYDHPEALSYLKQRGLNTPALYARFKIGFADQSLSKKLSSEQNQVYLFSSDTDYQFWKLVYCPLICPDYGLVRLH